MPSKWEDAPLREVVRDGDLQCSLEEAALVLARQEYPNLELAPWCARLDAYAELARPMLSEQADAAEIIGVVNDLLFRDMGFHGNVDDYYDARNSFLNDVLERRTGIPISLSTIYMAVARRVGLTLHGTAFPGHFLLVHQRPTWPIVIDAFDRGRILAQEDCERLLERFGSPDWDDGVLAPVPDIAILRRMLNNLKGIYLNQHDWDRLLRTSNQILVVTPEDVEEYFTRGVALAGLGELRPAIESFETYLARCPDAANRDTVLDVLSDLRQRLDGGGEASVGSTDE